MVATDPAGYPCVELAAPTTPDADHREPTPNLTTVLLGWINTSDDPMGVGGDGKVRAGAAR
jgi:hypothetical protein